MERDKEINRLLKMHKDTTAVLGEECKLIDDMSPDQAQLISSLVMLANQNWWSWSYNYERSLWRNNRRTRLRTTW